MRRHEGLSVTQVVPDLGLGGAEIVLCHLSSELSQQGHDVRVISLWPRRGTKVEGRLAQMGIEVEYLDKSPGPDIRIFRRLGKALTRNRSDIVHTHRMALRYAIPWRLVNKGTGLVHTVHTVAAQEGTAVDHVVFRRVYRSGAAMPVACGPTVGRSFETLYGYSPRVIMNGVEMSDRPVITRDNFEHGPFRICMVARFHPVKNHRTVVDTLSYLAAWGCDFHVDFVGDGPLRPSIEELISARGLSSRVTFFGELDDVSEVFRQSDVLLLASLYEGLPLSVMEAMSHGVPVVAPQVGGIPDLLGHGGGLMYAPNDAQGSAHTLQMLASERLSLRTLSREAAHVAKERFSRTRMTDEYVQVYRNLLGERGHTA